MNNPSDEGMLRARKSYEIVKPPLPATSFEEYANKAVQELAHLLDSGECDEQPYQLLLEKYPVLIPGTHPVIDAGHNGYFPGVISQPRLTGLQSRIPDFAVISWDSGTLYVALIELESPCKRWATGDGQATRELTQALQQLRDWQIWFDDPANLQRFRDEYRIPDHVWRDRELELRCVLVYGRRADLKRSHFERKRNKLAREGEVLMSWDRIAPNHGLADPLVVLLKPEGYVALSVPPTVRLGPSAAGTHAMIGGKVEAVLRSDLIPEERRDFMAHRWPYWDNWARDRDRNELTTFSNMLDLE